MRWEFAEGAQGATEDGLAFEQTELLAASGDFFLELAVGQGDGLQDEDVHVADGP
jgi:hypothetical protein